MKSGPLGMAQAQAPYQPLREAKINLVVIVEVSELFALVEERCATSHLGRQSLQSLYFF